MAKILLLMGGLRWLLERRYKQVSYERQNNLQCGDDSCTLGMTLLLNGLGEVVNPNTLKNLHTVATISRGLIKNEKPKPMETVEKVAYEARKCSYHRVNGRIEVAYFLDY